MVSTSTCSFCMLRNLAPILPILSFDRWYRTGDANEYRSCNPFRADILSGVEYVAFAFRFTYPFGNRTVFEKSTAPCNIHQSRDSFHGGGNVSWTGRYFHGLRTKRDPFVARPVCCTQSHILEVSDLDWHLALLAFTLERPRVQNLHYHYAYFRHRWFMASRACEGVLYSCFTKFDLWV